MQIEIIRQEPRFQIEINFAEFEFLYRLLGNHIVGEGKFRTINNNIYDSLDSCNHKYTLGVPKGTLPTGATSQTSVRLI